MGSQRHRLCCVPNKSPAANYFFSSLLFGKLQSINNFNNNFKKKERALRVTFPGWCPVMILSQSPIMRRTDEALLSTAISTGHEEELEALASLAFCLGHLYVTLHRGSLSGEYSVSWNPPELEPASLPASCCAAGESQGSAIVLHWLVPCRWLTGPT